MVHHNKGMLCYSWFDIRIHLRRFAECVGYCCTVVYIVSHCFNVIMSSARTLPFTPGVNEYHTGGVRCDVLIHPY